uniref:YqaJ viral recombinase family nuclease n=1 Tax=Acetatifactor sp. TaxID=1872090 RepID=UPI004056FE00
MPGTTQQRERHTPLVLVETADLPRDDWLNYRRRGIGGSDVAAIMGVSPFRTARDIYYDKLGVAVVEPDDSNWVALEVGHLLEDLVAKIFSKKTGYRVYQFKKMFYHPVYHFMLADVDYFVELPDGTTAILEIKTTNYNAKDNWWMGENEIVPEYYEMQSRHYMAVMDVDRVFFCCLYGNTEEEVIIREVKRDGAIEAEMIYLEQEFWMENVCKQIQPPYMEDGDLVMDSVRKYGERADENAPSVTLDITLAAALAQYMQLQEQKSRCDAESRKLESSMKRLRGQIVSVMGSSCKAVCQWDGQDYTVTYNPVRRLDVSKDNLLRLQLNHPEIYDEYVTVSEHRRFYVKAKEATAA